MSGCAAGLRCKQPMRYSAPRRRSRALKSVDTIAESGRLETPRFGHLMGSLYAAESDSVGPLALAHARQALERCEPLFGPSEPARASSPECRSRPDRRVHL